MKRLFAISALLMFFAVNSFSRAVFFTNPTVEFPAGVEPSIIDGHKYYQQDVLWVWEDGGEVINLHNEQDRDFIWSVDVTGDLTLADGHYLTQSGTHYEIHGSEIYFDGTTGTITVTATNPDFQGVAYSCSYTIIYHVQKESKKWDFNSSEWHLRGNHWDGSISQMSSHDTSPKYHKYQQTIHNVDGGEFAQEAEGLLFYAHNGDLGGNNPSGNTPAEDRFLCLTTGSSFTIPHSWFSGYANPRVRIKMGRFGGNGIKLDITNAKDALQKPITSSYEIGGSVWWGNKGDNNYRGEYHFFINDKNTDFTVKVQGNQYGYWLMLLTVEVYDSPEIKTENDVLGTCYQFLNWEGGTAASGDFYLHFRGKAEQSHVDANTITTTGNVTCNSSNLSDMNGSSAEKHHYTSNVGEYGTFRFRLDCYTHDGQYVTDYAWRSHSVGYMQKRNYPYTWDFTDVKTYYADGMQQEDNIANNTASAATVYSYQNNYNPVARNLWGKNENGDYALQLAADGAHDVHYCGGSQLWYGNTIIPELQYLAFTPVNFDRAYNGAMTITDGGLKFDQNMRDWWLWRIMIPQVPNNAVIYVRAHKERTDNFYNVGYYYGDATNKTEKSTFSTNALTETVVAREVAVVNDNSGDVIYAIPAPSATTNVTLFFQGVTVRKISVSVDPKTVNIKGYATESRDHAIDASLLPYFTGKDMATYLVSNPDYDGLTVTLTDAGASTGNYVIPANTGCVIRNKTDNNVLDMMATNNGFHLFVPDMHDDEESEGKFADVETNNQFMVPAVAGMESGVPSSSTVNGKDMVNYVLTYKYYKFNGGTLTGPFSGEEKFYRVYSKQTIKLHPNCAYMQLPAESVIPEGAGAAPRAPMFSFVFEDGEQTTTGIDNLYLEEENTPATSQNAEWYTLSGQKLNGRPSQRGFYIVNGKKVMVK